MSSARALTPMTVAEFLAWEATQPERWEFDGFEPVAMAGGSQAHDAIQVNLLTALNARLRGSACRAHGDSLKIEVNGRIRYPDAFVTCAPLEPRRTVRDDPVVVFEILSPSTASTASTASTDRIEKLRDYWHTPSILRYVLIEQDSIAATAFTRDAGRWSGRVLWPDDLIILPEIGTEIPLLDLYADLDIEALLRGPARDQALAST